MGQERPEVCRLCGAREGKVGTRGSTGRDVFGDVALLVFLIAQASDGVLTYVGVSTYGHHIEANPLIGWLMTILGEGAALATAKGAAVAFGIALHLSAVHRAVAALAGVFFALPGLSPVPNLFFFLFVRRSPPQLPELRP